MRLIPPEKLCLAIVAAIAVIDACLIATGRLAIDVTGYAFTVGVGLAMVAVGQFYRTVRRDERLALAATASGTFVLFTNVASILNYLLLPAKFPLIDAALAAADAGLGLHWPDLIALAAEHPLLSRVLSVVYFTSLPQMIAVILILCTVRDDRALYRFLVTGLVGVLIALCFWIFFPSFGTSVYFNVPQEFVQRAQLAVTPAYGAELTRLGREGAGFLTPKDALGLIAFPSVHMLMACLSVWFMARSWVFFLPAAALNLLMVPAILIHGGHHFVDVLGGVATFMFAYVLSGKALQWLASAEAGRTSIEDATR